MNRIYTSCVALIVVCGVLAFNITRSGPRVTSLETSGVLSNTTVTINFNNALNMTITPDISITPRVDFVATVLSSSVNVDIMEALSYDTEYNITINGVTDTRGKSTATNASFRTQQLAAVYIQKNADADRVYRTLIGTDISDQLLYSAPSINDIAVVKQRQLFVIRGSNEQTALYEAARNRRIPLPMGQPRTLASNPDSSIVYVTTTQDSSGMSRLYAYNAQDNTFTEIMLNDQPVQTSSTVHVAADGQSILYTDAAENTVYIDDPFDSRPPRSLGSYAGITRYLPSNNGILLQKLNGGYAYLSSQDGKLTDSALTLKEGLPLQLENGDSAVVQFNFDGTTRTQQAVLKTGEQRRIISESIRNSDRITNLYVSPNDEFFAIEKTPLPARYITNQSYSYPDNVRLEIVDQSGTPVTQITTPRLIWL